ncbi:hypothetical protein J7M22_01825 [Candidatus Poribacteria bacterium]|nr:hypothetical protein [Candidatus Poribacteria bacterium]
MEENEQWEYVWCYFRNLTHAIYREIRHIGPPTDSEAKCLIDETSPYFGAARKCQKNRKRLKSSVPFQAVTINDTNAIIAIYRELSGLAPQEVLDIFLNYRWLSSYGGSRWGDITRQLLTLKKAIDTSDLKKALAVCGNIQRLPHNSGRLVPAKQEWVQSKWLQEKWPVWCDSE